MRQISKPLGIDIEIITLMIRFLFSLSLIGLPLATIQASGLQCPQAHFAQTEAEPRLAFKEPRSASDWLQVIHRIENTSLFANRTFDENVLLKAHDLSPQMRQLLMAELSRNFISLKKEPNRRLAERLYTALANEGFEYSRLIREEEYSPEEAYGRLFTESAKLMSGVPTLKMGDIHFVVGVFREYVRENPDAHFILYGSAAAGRARLESLSDLDIKVFSAKPSYYDFVQGNLPWSVRRRILFSKAQAITGFLKRKFKNHPSLVQLSQRISTEHSYFEEPKKTWLGSDYIESLNLGEVNTFAIEVNSEGVFLHTFMPKKPKLGLEDIQANRYSTDRIFQDLN